MVKARRIVAGAVAAILTVALSACSSGGESDPSDPTSSASSSEGAFTPQDVADPGDDQLGNVRVGKLFAGALLQSSWKFPTSYESDVGETARAYTADEHFRITIQSGPGDQEQAAAAMASGQRQADAKGQETSLHTVSVKGREFAVLVQDTPEVGILTYAHAPEGDVNFYIIQLATDTSLADVPQEQLDGFLQTLGSLEFARG
ncbi:MAG: hypothetical protein ABW075_04555 [Aeromicrobium sp.]